MFLHAGAAVGTAFSSTVNRAPEPAPYGATPTVRQLAWSELEFYNFLHFTVNTFTDKEWGYGDESPSIFNPNAFDADSMIEDLKAAGSKGVILTCKHHDGFCLWPTKTTERSVKNSPFRGGNGDVVREVVEAAHRHGLRFGVYVSPWDRSQSTYGRPEYIRIYRQQLRELLSDYGPLFEIWHDGANGGDGYYGGAREKRIIDKLHYYEWANTWNLERQWQSGAVIFSDVGPDIRWVGNEKGRASETCWATYTPRSPSGGPGSPGDVVEAEATTGTRDGKVWMPAECDVSIRPGWFWHENENAKVKTPQELLDLYFASVGRGGSFLLNIPPDRRGLIHQSDRAALKGYGQRMRSIFGRSLAAGAHVMASNTRGNSHRFQAENILDGRRDTYWASDDGVTTPEVIITFPAKISFNVVRLREYLPLGQRVAAFTVEAWKGSDWKQVATGTSIGMCRILRTGTVVHAERVRFRVSQSPVCPAISEVSLFSDS
jgi:alpha-L-fucosidase